jgi:hypothetical protein
MVTEVAILDTTAIPDIANRARKNNEGGEGGRKKGEQGGGEEKGM